MKRLKSLLALATFGLSTMASPLLAGESNGIIALSYSDPNALVIVDTNAKKILYYTVGDRNGLSLKEVRSFEQALTVGNMQTSKGLSGDTENKTLSKLIKK